MLIVKKLRIYFFSKKIIKTIEKFFLCSLKKKKKRKNHKSIFSLSFFSPKNSQKVTNDFQNNGKK